MRALPEWLLAALRSHIDSMRALPQWLLVVNRGSLTMRALPEWLLAHPPTRYNVAARRLRFFRIMLICCDACAYACNMFMICPPYVCSMSLSCP